jgi:glutathione S-transferase
MSITLYDLAGADPAMRFSPYCWRTRFALAHKGLAVETVPWRFMDKPVIAFSGQDRVPVIRDADQVVSDSWAIALYLEDRYPTPTLFGGATGQAHARFINAWADAVLLPALAPMILRDIHDVIDEGDRAYFRSSREARFGRTLEQVQDGRESRLPAFRDTTMLPVRLTLRRQAWLGGDAPSYADYIVGGTLMWPRCSSPFALFAADDPITGWMTRVLALFDGLGQGAKTP